MPKDKKSIIVLSIIAIVILVSVIIFLVMKSLPLINKKQTTEILTEEQATERAEKTEDLIKEVKKIVKEIENNENEVSKIVKITGEDGAEREAIIIAPKTNPIIAETGEVVTENGTAVDNTAKAGDASAPQSSTEIDSEKLPDSTILLEMTRNSITPKQFIVKSGQAVSLAVTAMNDRSHIFRFEDDSLEAIAISVSPGKTKTITFNAPLESGEYIFFSDIGRYREKGAEGVMIVE